MMMMMMMNQQQQKKKKSSSRRRRLGRSKKRKKKKMMMIAEVVGLYGANLICLCEELPTRLACVTTHYWIQDDRTYLYMKSTKLSLWGRKKVIATP